MAPISSLPPAGSSTASLSLGRGPFALRGANARFFESQAPEIVLSGPAGTGKSITALLKLHFLASHVPGLRALICRKTRESLTEAALVTWEEKIVPENHPILQGGGQRRLRQAYRYPNGSCVVVGGLDKASKVMSTEYDVIYVQEAIELQESEWEALSSRLRNGKLPYQQLLADTNPDAPAHWLKKRSDAGRCLMLDSRHEENPALHNGREWTRAGLDYLARLDRLTGPRKQRLRHGRWVQAEGVVWEGWDRALHLVDRREIPWEWSRYWSVDFGFTCPFVCGFWAEDPDGRLWLYREIYRTRTLVEDHARRILELQAQEIRHAQLLAVKRWLRDGDLPAREADRAREQAALEARVARALRPRSIICDHDAEDRATLERHLRLPTIAARKEVSPGIQAVASRLRRAEDGQPRLFVLRDAVDGRDEHLEEGKKPIGFAEEVDSYVWDLSGGRLRGEEPVKADDHSCDQVRYMVAHKDLRVRLGGVRL